MPKLEINRIPEFRNNGLKRFVVLLPVARVERFEPTNDQFVFDVDFTFRDFEPTLIIIEATPRSVVLKSELATTGIGVYQNELSFTYPGEEQDLMQKLDTLQRLKYFIVFVADFNSSENDKRWKVLGSKELPMEIWFGKQSDPNRSEIKLSGQSTSPPPWYDPEADPREDLE